MKLSNWINNRGTFLNIDVEGIELQIVSLNEALKTELKELTTYQAMFDFVADVGLSHERSRIFDNDDLAEDLPVIWALDEFNQDCDPSVKYLIVEHICELSDITEILADKLEAEELAKLEAEDKVLNGDGDLPLSVSLGDIQADMEAHNNIN